LIECNYSAPTSSFSRHANTTYCAFNDGKKGSILANEWCFSIKPQHMVVSGANLPIYVLNSYDRVSNWSELLASGDQVLYDQVRMHERTGRPLGEGCFMEKMSSIVGRELGKKKPGPKPKGDN